MTDQNQIVETEVKKLLDKFDIKRHVALKNLAEAYYNKRLKKLLSILKSRLKGTIALQVEHGRTVETISTISEKFKLKASDLCELFFLFQRVYNIYNTISVEDLHWIGTILNLKFNFLNPEQKETIVFPEKGDAGRAAIIGVIGHIDHGKTTLVEKLAKIELIEFELHHITQIMRINKINALGNKCYLIDTPGHVDFSLIREITVIISDLLLIVIDITEGLKEQTIECIELCKKLNKKIVLILNKIDITENRGTTEVEKNQIYNQLSKFNINVSEYGGDKDAICISASTGTGIEDLLFQIEYQLNEMKLQFNTNTEPKIKAISILGDKKRVLRCLLVSGKLPENGYIYNEHYGVLEYQGLKKVVEDMQTTLFYDICLKSTEFTALLPGTILKVSNNKPLIESDINKRVARHRDEILNTKLSVFIIGNDSTQCIAIQRICNDDKNLECIGYQIGKLTDASCAIISSYTNVKKYVIFFNRKYSNEEKMLLTTYGIYQTCKCFDSIYDVKRFFTEMLNLKQRIIGKAKILKVFQIAGNVIAGCIVRNGRIHKHKHFLMTENNEKHKILTLQKKGIDCDEVKVTDEFGIVIEGINSYKIGEELVFYEEVN